VIESLVEESRRRDEEEERGESSEREALREALKANREKTDRLLDSYLEGLLDKETYQRKGRELGLERIGLEKRIADLGGVKAFKTEKAEVLLRIASTARIQFAEGYTEGQRKVLSTVLLNATLCDQAVVDYQLRRPFAYLQMDSSSALIQEKWAILDLNQ
jgi:hypothetical protein